jgi:protocatechuate 4,5-dioxygenase alpha chain
MSVYQVNKLCYDLKCAENREVYRRDPAAYMRRYGLDEPERAALDAGDYAWLFDHGVNFLVLSVFAGQRGVAGLPALMAVMKEQYRTRNDER